MLRGRLRRGCLRHNSRRLVTTRCTAAVAALLHRGARALGSSALPHRRLGTVHRTASAAAATLSRSGRRRANIAALPPMGTRAAVMHGRARALGGGVTTVRVEAVQRHVEPKRRRTPRGACREEPGGLGVRLLLIVVARLQLLLLRRDRRRRTHVCGAVLCALPALVATVAAALHPRLLRAAVSHLSSP